MNRHPYLRAYMAGVLLPSWFLLVVLAGFVAARLVYEIPIPVERVIAFPMAVVPNLWGLWNLLYVAMVLRHRIPLGVWGGILPVILTPGGMIGIRVLEISVIKPIEVFAVLPIVIGIYYLLWKHAVGFFNRVVGVE